MNKNLLEKVSVMSHDNQRPRDEAIEKIECYIIEHDLKPDDKLPSERAMCAMWNINRATLRSAIQQLILEGKIYNKKGSGTYVSREKLLRNLQDVDGFYETAIKAGRRPATKIIHIDTCETNKELGKKMKLTLGHKLLRISRIRFLEDIPVMYETSYFDYVRFPSLDKYITESPSIYKVLEEIYNVDITGGKEKLSIAYCDEKEAEYLQVKQGDPVIFQSGIVYDDKEVIFEYFEAITRSEYVCFASELRRR
ncbi:MAG: transcriptional regulator, GntR family [Defluviitaleaceae bacterium]|jgi:GntR family transcriptional regulator|nr:transcriptional regulator, GntR family [Defluviitaleaceae bacterium]